MNFLLAALTKPFKVGAIAPSSRALAEAMLVDMKPDEVSGLIEIGPGTGAMTRVILEKLKDRSQYLGIDINARFVEKLTTHYPGARFVHDSAENLGELLKPGEKVDYIVCSLPWAIWPTKVQKQILNKLIAPLRKGGKFKSFAYIQTMHTPAAARFRELLQDSFSSFETSSIVWRNLPPAVVYHCIK